MNPLEKENRHLYELQKNLYINSSMENNNNIYIQNELNNLKKIEEDSQKKQIEEKIHQNYEIGYQMRRHIRENIRKNNRLHENIETIAQEIKKKETQQVKNMTKIKYGNVKKSTIINVIGNGNKVNNEFDKKFDELINEINKSNLQNKDMIIEELNSKKNDTNALKII